MVLLLLYIILSYTLPSHSSQSSSPLLLLLLSLPILLSSSPPLFRSIFQSSSPLPSFSNKASISKSKESVYLSHSFKVYVSVVPYPYLYSSSFRQSDPACFIGGECRVVQFYKCIGSVSSVVFCLCFELMLTCSCLGF